MEVHCSPHTCLLAPETQSQPWSLALPSSLAHLMRFPPYSHLPSLCSLLSRTQLAQRGASCPWGTGSSFIKQANPSCPVCPRMRWTASGEPDHRSQLREWSRKDNHWPWLQAPVSVLRVTSGQQEDFRRAGVVRWKKLEWKAGWALERTLLSPGRARVQSLAVGSQQGSWMAGHTCYFKSTSKPKIWRYEIWKGQGEL